MKQYKPCSIVKSTYMDNENARKEMNRYISGKVKRIRNTNKQVFRTTANMGLIHLRDSDRDGVINIYDCSPYDPNRQGILHDIGKSAIGVAKEVGGAVKERVKSEYEYAKERGIEKIRGEESLAKRRLLAEIYEEERLKAEIEKEKQLAKAKAYGIPLRYTGTGKIVSASKFEPAVYTTRVPAAREARYEEGEQVRYIEVERRKPKKRTTTKQIVRRRRVAVPIGKERSVYGLFLPSKF